MNWHPMSTPPTEAGLYLFWLNDACVSTAMLTSSGNYYLCDKEVFSGSTNIEKLCRNGYTHWARVTAPGEEREYTALAVMNDAGEFETEQVVQMTDEFAAAILYEDNEDGLGCAQIGAVMHGGRVVRVRARVEEV